MVDKAQAAAVGHPAQLHISGEAKRRRGKLERANAATGFERYNFVLEALRLDILVPDGKGEHFTVRRDCRIVSAERRQANGFSAVERHLPEIFFAAGFRGKINKPIAL